MGRGDHVGGFCPRLRLEVLAQVRVGAQGWVCRAFFSEVKDTGAVLVQASESGRLYVPSA